MAKQKWKIIQFADLERWRDKAGLSKRDMAAKLQVTSVTYSNWEKGRCAPPITTQESVKKFLARNAKRLGMTPSEAAEETAATTTTVPESRPRRGRPPKGSVRRGRPRKTAKSSTEALLPTLASQGAQSAGVRLPAEVASVIAKDKLSPEAYEAALDLLMKMEFDSRAGQALVKLQWEFQERKSATVSRSA